MAYLQRRRITIDSDLDSQATWRYKLPSVGAYTAFELVVEAQREADRDVGESPISIEQECTKIELLEGGTRPIISLTGQQLDALNYWEFKVPTVRKYHQGDAQWNSHHFFLMGGRGLTDREYGYDMGRFGEVYVELSHDMTAAVAEGFDEETAKVTLWGYQWMGADIPYFTGYFRSRQLAYWTTSGADIIKTIEIPVGNPMRRVCVQAVTRGRTIGGTTKEIELVVNKGEYSPVHIKSALQWLSGEVAEYGLENEVGGIDYMKADTMMDLPFWFTYYNTILVSPYEGAESLIPFIWGLTTPPGRIMAAGGEADTYVFSMRGMGFQKCLRIGFDHEYDGFDLLPTRGLGSLDLICTEVAAAYGCRVFVQDVLSY